jgi:cephalosporin-C deacetylase
MKSSDTVIKELYHYKPPIAKKRDFDDFWKKTIAITKKNPLNPQKSPYAYPSSIVKAFDISYNGFDDTRIHGWYIVPTFVKQKKLPCLIHYHGYTDNRGSVSDFMQWIALGVAVVSVDCREQSGLTGNNARYSSGAMQSVTTKGLLDKNEYYYRAVFMDCLKAIDFACMQKEVDTSRIIIEGGSQGGGIGMAICALDSRPWLAMLDVPSYSNLEEKVQGCHGSHSAIAEFLKVYPDKISQVYETLSYFDTMNMAEKITCKILASVGLKDNVCPARLYFASYNRIKSPKEIRIYPFAGHEGGGRIHNEIKLNFLWKNLRRTG